MMAVRQDDTAGPDASLFQASRLALWALAIIFAANFLNYMDRMLVSAQEKQLAQAFALTTTEFGWLWTLFTIGYLACAIPTGYLADRYNRSWLFAGCVIIWSAATIATGRADSKFVLYVSRILIGVGEAGCLIIGPAMLSDFFPRQLRGRALAIFYLGQPLGGTAGYVLPGELSQRGFDWPLSFFMAGYPGFLIAALLLLLADPPRGSRNEGGGHHGHGAKPGEYLQLLKNRTLLLIILAQAFSVMILIPLLHFGKKFLLEKHDLTERNATFLMGLIMVGGAAGIGVSGIIGDRLARRFQGAYALLAGVGFLISWPCLLIVFNSANYAVFLPLLMLAGFCMFLCMPAVNTQIANVVSPAQRAAAWALAVSILHLLGDTLAPPLFGVVEKQICRPSAFEQRQVAFEWFSGALLLASACCFLAARTARADIARFAQEEGTGAAASA